jgi:hypothetical protein
MLTPIDQSSPLFLAINRDDWPQLIGCSDFLVEQGMQWRKFGKSIPVIPAYAGMTGGILSPMQFSTQRKV